MVDTVVEESRETTITETQAQKDLRRLESLIQKSAGSDSHAIIDTPTARSLDVGWLGFVRDQVKKDETGLWSLRRLADMLVVSGAQALKKLHAMPYAEATMQTDHAAQSLTRISSGEKGWSHGKGLTDSQTTDMVAAFDTMRVVSSLLLRNDDSRHPKLLASVKDRLFAIGTGPEADIMLNNIASSSDPFRMLKNS